MLSIDLMFSGLRVLTRVSYSVKDRQGRIIKQMTKIFDIAQPETEQCWEALVRVW